MSSSITLTTKELLDGSLSLLLTPARGTTIPGPGDIFAYGPSGAETYFSTLEGTVRLASPFASTTARFEVTASGNAEGVVQLDQAINTDVILSSGVNFVVAVPAGQLRGEFSLPLADGAQVPIRDAAKRVQQLIQAASRQQHAATA